MGTVDVESGERRRLVVPGRLGWWMDPKERWSTQVSEDMRVIVTQPLWPRRNCPEWFGRCILYVRRSCLLMSVYIPTIKP